MNIEGLRIGPAYFCFQDGGDGGNGNGNGNGNGDGDGVGDDGGLGDAFGGTVGDFGYGLGVEGMMGESPGEALGEAPGEAPSFDISLEAYTPPSFDISLEAYTPPSYDINEAFEFAQPPSFEAEPSLTRPISVTESNLALAKFAIDALNVVYSLFSIALSVLGFAPTAAAPAARGTSLGLGLGEKGLGLLGVKTSERGWLSEAIVSFFAPQTVAALQSQKAQAAPAPTPPVSSQAYASKGTPTSFTPGTPVGTQGGGGIFSIPVTPRSALSSLAIAPEPSYPALSTSLFGAQKETSGGLMIFPTSAKGIEPEGSSLLKKQQPSINTTSILFLLGMGAVGMVLRKGARA